METQLITFSPSLLHSSIAWRSSKFQVTSQKKKAVIASRYLGPQAKDASGLGLAEADVQLEPAAVDILIKYYCRENGVRNLKKRIEKVCLVSCPCKGECGLLSFELDLSKSSS